MSAEAQQRLVQACEKAGADARLHGFARADNPYARSAARSVSLLVAADRLRLAEAWWRGWDRAHAETPHAPPPRPAAPPKPARPLSVASARAKARTGPGGPRRIP
jgi:hypothetical protein